MNYKYSIQVNPFNPVEYLACCGIFEILTRFDTTATSWWETDGQPQFWLESEIDEASFLTCLKQTLTHWELWKNSETIEQPKDENDEDHDEDHDNDGDGDEGDDKAISNENEQSEDHSNEKESDESGILITVPFSLHEKTITLYLDWWYETLNAEKKIEKKSAWKMYAGQQTAYKTSHDMVKKSSTVIGQPEPQNITSMLQLCVGMSGRFGFDPRSSRDALDTGYSANDVKQPVSTWTFSELLTTIGAQYFFPQRTKPGAGITSTRGWIKNDTFQYALWKKPLPIPLARVAAGKAAIRQDWLLCLQARRVNRDKYSNFRMATLTI